MGKSGSPYLPTGCPDPRPGLAVNQAPPGGHFDTLLRKVHVGRSRKDWFYLDVSLRIRGDIQIVQDMFLISKIRNGGQEEK